MTRQKPEAVAKMASTKTGPMATAARVSVPTSPSEQAGSHYQSHHVDQRGGITDGGSFPTLLSICKRKNYLQTK